MIRKMQSERFWPDEEHHVVPPYSVSGGRQSGKWTILRAPGFRPTYQAPEWDRSLWEFRIEARPSSPASGDELFQQAAAKVHHKIQINRKILGGAPCIAGTRIPVYAILQLVEAGYTRKRILKSFPSLSQEDLEAALRFSVIVMER